ncbi:hypothetical protein [Nocardiopsis halophila]|uniref:hypothetical protein n=1 Tax=Nocardiopsis halophila TaxID=141692 RepID=UPI0012682E2D|nr:hypothetical protein [Nocardiopsis halophila]
MSITEAAWSGASPLGLPLEAGVSHLLGSSVFVEQYGPILRKENAKVLHGTIKTLGVFAAAAALSVGAGIPAAYANSGVRVVYGGDDEGSGEGNSNEECAGQWLHRWNEFQLQDRDLGDDDWCYIDYRFEGQENFSRVSIPQDIAGWKKIPVKNFTGAPRVEFTVCQERQNDSDICLGWRFFDT